MLGPSLCGGSHRIEQEDFSQKEKDPLGHFGEFPCSNSSSLLSTWPLASLGVCAWTWECSHRRELGLQASPGEGAHPPGSAHTSFQRELKLQEPLGQGAQQPGVCLPTGECSHLISEGAETTGTTWGRVPSNRECAYPPGSAYTSSQRKLRLQALPGEGAHTRGSACTSFQRELRLQAPPRAGCQVNGSVCTLSRR